MVAGQDGGSRVRWTKHHSLWGAWGQLPPERTRYPKVTVRSCTVTLQGLAPGHLGQVPAMLVRPECSLAQSLCGPRCSV